ncbi:hypothetical protein NMY22_g6271 [Coprinellus aureogranulatus]|nr:hypothetical protein NMY22_g6271 [Coprinellus aureogranulatus]
MADSNEHGARKSTPILKKPAWFNSFRRERRPSDAEYRAHGDAAPVNPSLSSGSGRRKASVEYERKGHNRHRSDSQGYAGNRLDKPLPIPSSTPPHPPLELKDPQPISLPRRRTTSSVDRTDGQRTWDLQRAEMENMVKARDTMIAQKDAELKALKRDNRKLGKQAEELELEHQESKRELEAAMHAQARKHAAQLEELQRRCKKLEKELEQSKKLLDLRTQELGGAQAFMTTADQYSVADVSRLVEQLNDEFFQCAMDLSDSLLQHREASSQSGVSRDRRWNDAVAESRRVVAQRWSDDTLDRLETDIAQDDTVMFECLVQNVFVVEFKEIIRSICLDDREVDKHLRRVWKDILTSQEVPIAKNWLSLTTSTSKGRARDHSMTMRFLQALLVVAGWREPEPKVLDQVVRGKLADMTSKAESIRDMIFRGVLSTILEVFSYNGDRVFDPTSMQDAYEVPERSTPSSRESSRRPTGAGPIVCSAGLGLRCVNRRRSSSSSGSRKDIALRSKVLLVSTLGPGDSKDRTS